MYEPIEIDGGQGEGGGQIVRTSAALSAITGRPLRLIRMRAARKNPGLQAQHLTGLKAVAALCQGRTEGLQLGSQRAGMVPGAIRGGQFHFTVPTAGSSGLVLQAILPVLLRAPQATEVVIDGGTHVKNAPSFDHTAVALVPRLRAVGAHVEVELERPGFFPRGGGRIVVRTTPWRRPVALNATASPDRVARSGRVYAAGLPDHVTARASQRLRARGYAVDAAERAEKGRGPGFAVVLRLCDGRGDHVVTGLGERGTPAETIVDRAVDEAEALAERKVPVGPHLADQLLPMLVLGAGGRFRTIEPTLHFETQRSIIARFLGDRITTRVDPDGGHRVDVKPA